MVRPETVHRSRVLRWCAPGVANPSVWHLNRRSAARGMAVGLFWMIIPIPWQVVPAALCAVYFRANIAITVAAVLISNPLTWAPLLYATYQFGRWVMGRPPIGGDGTTLWDNLGLVWQPLFLGAVLAGAVLGTAGYFASRGVWRVMVVWAWRRRRRRRYVIRDT